MAVPLETWNPKRLRAALLIASWTTIKAAALEVHAGERTLTAWMDEPDYRRYIDELKSELLDRTAASLVSAGIEAVEVLRAALKSEAESIRVRSAVAILDHLVRIREHGDLSVKVAELERRLQDEQRPRLAR